jgi:anti-sigma B factor antagonist
VRTLAHFSVTVEPLGEARLVRVRGDLDLSTAGRLRLELDAARADGVATLLDLSAVNFIDSAGLKVLLRSARAAEAEHRSWCIVRASSAVRRLAEVSGTTSQLALGEPPEKPERLLTPGTTARVLVT